MRFVILTIIHPSNLQRSLIFRRLLKSFVSCRISSRVAEKMLELTVGKHCRYLKLKRFWGRGRQYNRGKQTRHQNNYMWPPKGRNVFFLILFYVLDWAPANQTDRRQVNKRKTSQSLLTRPGHMHTEDLVRKSSQGCFELQASTAS